MADKEGGAGFKLLILAALLALPSYFGLEERGWIPHTSEAVISAQPTWMNGESKDCVSYPLDAQMAERLNKQTGDATARVACDDGPEHRISIKFFGRVVQPEFASVEWRCTRQDGGFECQQTGGKPKRD